MRQKLRAEIEKELLCHILPFWEEVKDTEHGGFVGVVTYDLKKKTTEDKGCILNSRILWFFSNCYSRFQKEEMLQCATHAYLFLRDAMVDKENGGVFWSVTAEGKPSDTTKHTYNLAFAIYALASYYRATKEEEALALAYELYETLEGKCRDSYGYMEAFDRYFQPVENDKLSENNIIAQKTMNTLLHVFEAYTELYLADQDAGVKEKMLWMLDTFADKVYAPDRKRLEVFFDEKMNSILDLHSYGHDIEAAWLLDRGLLALQEESYQTKLEPVIASLEQTIYERAYVAGSLMNECEKGVNATNRIWWVQAEAMVGFLNAFDKHPQKQEYMDAVYSIWDFIKQYLIDSRDGGEWLEEVDEQGRCNQAKNIVDAWKCPYHNGRMCLELLERLN